MAGTAGTGLSVGRAPDGPPAGLNGLGSKGGGGGGGPGGLSSTGFGDGCS